MRKESQGQYTFVVIPNHPMADSRGRILEHRFRMAEHLGRSLTSEEVVHHRDGDMKNNDITNLELMSGAKHTSLHHKGIEITFVCPECGAAFCKPPRKVNGVRTFCSKSCASSFYGKKRHRSENRLLKHGKESGYRRGCRCQDCKAAHAKKMRDYRQSCK